MNAPAGRCWETLGDAQSSDISKEITQQFPFVKQLSQPSRRCRRCLILISKGKRKCNIITEKEKRGDFDVSNVSNVSQPLRSLRKSQFRRLPDVSNLAQSFNLPAYQPSNLRRSHAYIRQHRQNMLPHRTLVPLAIGPCAGGVYMRSALSRAE